MKIVHHDFCVPSKPTYLDEHCIILVVYLLVFQRRRSEHDGRHAFYFLDGGKTEVFGIDGSGKSTGFFFFITIASGATVVVQNNYKISKAVARKRSRQLRVAVRSKQQKFKNHQLTISTRRRMAMHELRMCDVSSVLVVLDGYFFNGFWLRRPPQTGIQRYYRVRSGSQGRGVTVETRVSTDGGHSVVCFGFPVFSLRAWRVQFLHRYLY